MFRSVYLTTNKNFPESHIVTLTTVYLLQQPLLCRYSRGGKADPPLDKEGVTMTLGQLVKNLPTVQKTWVRSLGREDPLEKGKATHSRILAWRIPRTVQSVGSQRVGHD